MKIIFKFRVALFLLLLTLSVTAFASDPIIPCPSMEILQAAANKIDDGDFGSWGYRAFSHSKIVVGGKEWMIFSIGNAKFSTLQEVIQKGSNDIKNIFLQVNEIAAPTEDLYVCFYLTNDKHAGVMVMTPIDSVRNKKN